MSEELKIREIRVIRAYKNYSKAMHFSSDSSQ